MSTDPNSGVAYIRVLDSGDGQLTDGAQFSGVPIAPDEILTVVHGVTDAKGAQRSYGTTDLGYDGGTLSGGDQIDGVHVLDDIHTGGMQDDAGVSTDCAMVHMSAPVAGAQTIALGLARAGAYETSGYPAIDDGAWVTVRHALTQGIAPGGDYLCQGRGP